MAQRDPQGVSGSKTATDVPEQLTELLLRWSGGDATALKRLTPLVYSELRKIARYHLNREHSDCTLESAALVNEAYLRLVAWENADSNTRVQFFAVATQVMRRILVDQARERNALKRGGRAVTLNTTAELGITGGSRLDVIVIDRMLRELEELDPGLVRVVELRFFGGLTVEETASALGLSPATVKRDWVAARAWLYRRLNA